MDSLVNLVVLMSVLSIVSERVANALKLGHPELRERRRGPRAEKERERRIAHRALAASLLLAVVLKADLFAILAHLDAPWDTLGWFRPAEAGSRASVSRVLQALCGTVATGFALSFGSKFWHGMMDAVGAARR